MRFAVLFFFFLSHSLIAQNEVIENQLVKTEKSYEFTRYYANGQIAQRGPIKNKKLHGVWVSYSPEGKKVSQGTFKKGKKTGKWFFWNEEGLIEADFNENKLVSAVSWDKGKILADK